MVLKAFSLTNNIYSINVIFLTDCNHHVYNEQQKENFYEIETHNSKSELLTFLLKSSTSNIKYCVPIKFTIASGLNPIFNIFVFVIFILRCD